MPGGPLDLTNVKVSNTFPRLIQISAGSFYDGLGDPVTFPAGPTGPAGASLSNLYPSGGSPTIIPGSVTINSVSDVVDSYEYFDSNYTGVYLQSNLPNISSGDSFYIGLFEYGGGLIYYAKIYYSSGPYIELYDQLNIIASGNYTANDYFSIYLDGYNVNYRIGNNTYTTSQSVNNLFACTILSGGFSGAPVNFSNVNYYPTGKKGNSGIYTTQEISTASASIGFYINYYGVTYTGGICTINLPIGAVPVDEGKIVIIADEVGGISSYGRGILIQGSGGQLINGNSSVLMKIERMSLTLLFRNNSWKTI